MIRQDPDRENLWTLQANLFIQKDQPAKAAISFEMLRRLGKAWAWRPLLEIPRETLHRHASEAALDWIEDPSNADERFSRNFLRHQVIPLLAERWPQSLRSVLESTTAPRSPTGVPA
mgnify:CR=1 FL=1